MTDEITYRFTLRELAARAAQELATSDVDQSSGRVSEVPSSRTIRYYATHGLLDSPMDWEGRTAIYGRKHLLQLVAIKRLQARGQALSEIQERLVGLSDEALESIAMVSDAGAKLAGDEPVGEAAVESRRRDGSFWASRGSRGTAPAPTRQTVEEVGAMRLDDDVLLVLEGLSRTLDADDRHAIRVAAEPLLHLLKARRLVGTSTQEGGQDE